MSDARRSGIERLLRPRSIAIVGASPTPGSLGNGVMGNLARFGFRGEVHLVNPGRADIDGKPCFKSPADLPEGVDCVVLAIPGKGVLDAARQCATRGVGGLIVFGAGFAEAGEEGRAAQAELAKIAQTPEVRDALRAQGAESVGSSPEDFSKYLRAEVDKWAKTVKAQGLQAD